MDSALRCRWFLLESGCCPPADNMAWDEALLERAARTGQPVLRLYGWASPAATFGYFQRYAEVSRLTPLRPLLRRPTGGGLVPHEADWTYSLVFPPVHPWYELKAVDSYQRVHGWIASAFAALGVPAELAPARRGPGPGQCFVGAERFDVVERGRKIAGAAQRRARLGLLIQGSIQPPERIPRHAFEQTFRAEGTRLFGADWSPFQPDAALCQRVRALADDKYARKEHNEKR